MTFARRQFTGTEQIYRHDLVRHIVYSDGAQHVAEAGEAYWLLDKIACAQLKQRYAEQSLQRWSMTVRDDRTANLVCSFTDFPLDTTTFYVTDRTILLPSEY